MIRFTPQGVVVWFQLSNQPSHKVTFTLNQYRAYFETPAGDADVKAALFQLGRIEPLTEADSSELERWFPNCSSMPAPRPYNKAPSNAKGGKGMIFADADGRTAGA